MNPGPNLLLQWEPRWQGFRTSLGPALGRSAPPLALECGAGLASPRSSAASFCLHLAVVWLLVLAGGRLRTEQQLLRPTTVAQDNVIYFSGPYLPAVQDQGGAREGGAGRSGGQERFHREQVIRVARGSRAVDTVADAPQLKLPLTSRDVANLVAISTDAGPAPVETLAHSRFSPAAAPEAVAPASAATGQHVPLAPMPEVAVVAPRPDLPDRDRVKLNAAAVAMEVVPPPVSAPVTDSDANARLRLPAPAVVPPPPGISQREGRVLSRGVYDGATPEVVPPPAAPERGDIAGRTLAASHDTPQVVAPPPSMTAAQRSGHGIAKLSSAPDVVAPPPSVTDAGHSGQTLAGLGKSPEVVAPSPSISGTAHGGGSTAAIERAGSITATLATGNGAGHGSGRGSGDGKDAVIISAHPGTEVGIPGGGAPGAIAMSPTGRGNGLGGSGGGKGVGNGTGTGSARAGNGSGSGKTGTGMGNAGEGTSASAGPGGVGEGAGGGMAGVTISGNTVNIPSFGASGPVASPTRGPREAPGKSPAVTIVATSRSGGALNQYGALKGDRVYTIYIDTRLGPAIMEYTDGTVNNGFNAELTAPQPVRADLPADIVRARVVVDCIVDRAGILRNLKIVEGAGSAMAVRLLAALHDWRFRPVLRGNEAVEVHAMLGFDVDTR